MTSRKLGEGINGQEICKECSARIIVNFPPQVANVISSFPCQGCGAYLIIMAVDGNYEIYSGKQKDDGLEPIPVGSFPFWQGGQRLFFKSSLI